MLFMACVCHAFFLFIVVLWSPEGKGLTSWLLFVIFVWYPGTGVVLDCTDS